MLGSLDCASVFANLKRFFFKLKFEIFDVSRCYFVIDYNPSVLSPCYRHGLGKVISACTKYILRFENLQADKFTKNNKTFLEFSHD